MDEQQKGETTFAGYERILKSYSNVSRTEELRMVKESRKQNRLGHDFFQIDESKISITTGSFVSNDTNSSKLTKIGATSKDYDENMFPAGHESISDTFSALTRSEELQIMKELRRFNREGSNLLPKERNASHVVDDEILPVILPSLSLPTKSYPGFSSTTEIDSEKEDIMQKHERKVRHNTAAVASSYKNHTTGNITMQYTLPTADTNNVGYFYLDKQQKGEVTYAGYERILTAFSNLSQIDDIKQTTKRSRSMNRYNYNNDINELNVSISYDDNYNGTLTNSNASGYDANTFPSGHESIANSISSLSRLEELDMMKQLRMQNRLAFGAKFRTIRSDDESADDCINV
jgi:hypothetical protein